MGCVLTTDCIALDVTDEGVLDPSWVFAPESNVSCGPAGLFSPKLLHQLGCLSNADQLVVPPFGSFASQFSPVATITNPSPTRTAFLNVSVIFGTPQINLNANSFVTVLDLIGVAPTGFLGGTSYTPVNTLEYGHNASFGAVGGRLASPPQAANIWSCPLPIAPGAAIDVQWERRCSEGQAAAGSTVLLRGSFMFLWEMASS